MSAEIPDEPNPRAVALARWMLLALGATCLAVAATVWATSVAPEPASVFGTGVLAVALLAAALLGPPRWAVAVALLMVQT